MDNPVRKSHFIRNKLSFESREHIGSAELVYSVPSCLLRGKRTPLGLYLDRRLTPSS